MGSLSCLFDVRMLLPVSNNKLEEIYRFKLIIIKLNYTMNCEGINQGNRVMSQWNSTDTHAK